MNGEQVATVLARVYLGDNRQVDPEGFVLAEWASVIGRLDFDDAIEAVTMHRTERPGVYLEPGHIVANVRLIRARQERAERVRLAMERGPRPPIVGEFDREQHEREFRAALAKELVARGRDPLTGLPVEKESPPRDHP